MRLILFPAAAVLTLSFCAHDSTSEAPVVAVAAPHVEAPAAVVAKALPAPPVRRPTGEVLPAKNQGELWHPEDPQLVDGEGGLTIYSLKALAESRDRKDLEKLENLFRHGVSMDQLPVGYAAGTGARVFGTTGSVGSFVDKLVGAEWYGKIFFESVDKVNTHGLNRIKADPLDSKSAVLAMASFTSEMRDSDPLIAPSEVASNFVVLNYAKPTTKNYPQELALTHVQVYDVMVAVPGKYGPIYIGKTWKGKYAEFSHFIPDNSKHNVAWFFLDFNPGALAEQKQIRLENGDNSTEEEINFHLAN